MKQPGKSFNEFYDVIIVGAGIGGLTAGALLSKCGFSVCIFEKEPHAGGYLAGFRRKDFIFDTAIHWLNQYNEQGAVTKIFRVLGDDFPKAITLERTRRYKGNGFDYLLTNNPDELRDRLINDFPHEKEGLMRFFRCAKRIGASLNKLSSIFRSEETMGFPGKILSKINQLKVIMPFIPFVTYSGERGLKKGLNKFFKDKRLHEIFASETELIGCMVPIGWSYANDFQCPPKGGGQVIPMWLQHIVEYYNNHVITQCCVEEILVNDNVCTGVKINRRGEVRQISSKYVVAACDIEALYERMLPAHVIPEKLKHKLRTAELYTSSLTISIALDCTVESLGFSEELVHLVDENSPFDAHNNGDPHTAEITILPPSCRDKSLAPEGCGTLTLFMPAVMDYKNNWLTMRNEKGEYIRNEAYRDLKKEMAEIIISRVEKAIAPTLHSHILFYDVATPVTHYRYTGNKNGTMMGAKPGRKNMQDKIAHYQTPVKNLLLGGHWAELGGGVPIAAKAGTNACLLILKKEQKKIFTALAEYIDGKIALQQLFDKASFKPYNNSWKQTPTPAEIKAGKMKLGK
ncbi:MAG: NAD(P)/FAD-dependent oxidoreductase [Agriterribacter sp.]